MTETIVQTPMHRLALIVEPFAEYLRAALDQVDLGEYGDTYATLTAREDYDDADYDELAVQSGSRALYGATAMLAEVAASFEQRLSDVQSLAYRGRRRD